MPSSRAPATVDQVRAQYRRQPTASATSSCRPAPPHCVRMATGTGRTGRRTRCGSTPTRCVAIGFTSGSTGQPRAYTKTWRSLPHQHRAEPGRARRPASAPARSRTWSPRCRRSTCTAWRCRCCCRCSARSRCMRHDRCSRPTWRARCTMHPRPPLLVTTPVHLRALVASGLSLPPLAGIVSATAPLPPELAAQAEARFGCEVREVFGSTETCVFARRRTARDAAWTPLPGVRLAPQPDGTAVHAPHLSEPVVLADLMEIACRRPLRTARPQRRPARHRRQARLAGRSHPQAARRSGRGGRRDVPARRRGRHRRAPHRRAGGRADGWRRPRILHALRQQLDPVFLPRPLRRVAALPRNETGKLPRDALQTLLHAHEPA